MGQSFQNIYMGCRLNSTGKKHKPVWCGHNPDGCGREWVIPASSLRYCLEFWDLENMLGFLWGLVGSVWSSGGAGVPVWKWVTLDLQQVFFLLTRPRWEFISISLKSRNHSSTAQDHAQTMTMEFPRSCLRGRLSLQRGPPGERLVLEVQVWF